MTFPAEEWADRELDDVIAPDRDDIPSEWRLLPVETEDLKGIGPIDVRTLARAGMWFPSRRIEETLTEAVDAMERQVGRYWPRHPHPGAP